MSGSDFIEMFVGLGTARMRDLFEQATNLAPCLVFIDDLDALGKARGAGRLSGHNEREQTRNQLLVAERLLEKETVESEEFLELIGRKPDLREAAAPDLIHYPCDCE